jgi:hypothetical protein
VLGRNIRVTTPILSRIIEIYDSIYRSGVHYGGKSGLKSLLSSWQSAVVKAKCAGAQASQVWIDHFVECLDKHNHFLSFKRCLINNILGSNRQTDCNLLKRNPDLLTALAVYDTLSLAALMLGSHGVAHLLGKITGIDVGNFAEKIEIGINSNFFSTIECGILRLLPYIDIIDGLFIIGGTGDKLIDIDITVYDLSGVSSLPADEVVRRLGLYIRELGGCGGNSDMCRRAWDEEKSRLERIFSVVGAGHQQLRQLDQHLKQRPLEASPPRSIFRFMLPRIISSHVSKGSLSQSQLGKLVQYVWPRYVSSCADGCQLCVLMPRGACVYPPLHGELKVSKRLALKLLEPLCAAGTAPTPAPSSTGD